MGTRRKKNSLLQGIKHYLKHELVDCIHCTYYADSFFFLSVFQNMYTTHLIKMKVASKHTALKTLPST